MEGVLGSTFEECKVESSAYECIGLNVTESAAVSQRYLWEIENACRRENSLKKDW